MKKKPWNLARIWKTYSPPGRPSKSELKIIDDYLKIKKIKSALILGSTPEFRDLLHKHKIHSTIVDYNEESYKILAGLKQRKGKEDFIKSDWRKINTNKKFDLILGDFSLNCLSKEDFPKIFDIFNKILNKEGYIIQRIIIRKNNNNNKLKQIFLDYRVNHKKYTPWEAMWYPLVMNSYNFKDEFMLFSEAFRRMKEANKKGLMKDSEFKWFCDKEWENLDKLKWFIPQLDFFKKEINKNFKIEKIITTKDIFSKHMPIFILTRK